MKEKLSNKYVLFAIIIGSFLSILVLSGNFRATLARRQAIRDTQKELEKVDSEIDKLKSQLASLDTTPHVHEDLVRRELGYIKPGEKEIRFVQSIPKPK